MNDTGVWSFLPWLPHRRAAPAWLLAIVQVLFVLRHWSHYQSSIQREGR